MRQAASLAQANAQRESITLYILVGLRCPGNDDSRSMPRAVQEVCLEDEHRATALSGFFLMGLGLEIRQPNFAPFNGSQGRPPPRNPFRR